MSDGLTKDEFKAFIKLRDSSGDITFRSIIRQWQSANTLSEGSVSIEVLEETVKELYKGKKDADKGKVQKDTKTRNRR